MKKTYRSFFCLLAVLLLSVSALPAASALFSERLYYYGAVEEISRAADGTVESVLVTAEGQETYEMVITERTQWQDHDEKTTSDPATLAVGEQICVVHDPAVMMSLPPQSVAYTVIRNFPAQAAATAPVQQPENKETNVLAIVSLVLGILSIVLGCCTGWIGALFGIGGIPRALPTRP